MKDQNYFDACYSLIKGSGMDLVTTPQRLMFLMTPEGCGGRHHSDVSMVDFLVDRDLLFLLYPEHVSGLNDLMVGIEIALERKGSIRNYCYEEDCGGWQ